MKADQYSRNDSVKVKARADYQCELCGSSRMVQAHAPGGNHADWRDGVCLCAQHHWEQHPDLPRSLFFTKTRQPYWPNVSARALAREFGCHSRTVVQTAKRLQVPSNADLSKEDRQRLWDSIMNGGRGAIEIPSEGKDANYVFKASEVAKILKVHINTVYMLVRTGRLRACRVVHDWRVRSGDLANFIGVSANGGGGETPEFGEVVTARRKDAVRRLSGTSQIVARPVRRGCRVVCPSCRVWVLPRKELTNRAQLEDIPVEDLAGHPASLATIWTGGWVCPNCRRFLFSEEEPDSG